MLAGRCTLLLGQGALLVQTLMVHLLSCHMVGADVSKETAAAALLLLASHAAAHL